MVARYLYNVFGFRSSRSGMLSTDEETNETHLFEVNLQSIFKSVVSILLVTLTIALGLFVSTELSGYNVGTLLSPVDKAHCTCGCWDGFFRGRHGRGGYKTFYFNYEKQMIVILGLVLGGSELLRRFFLELIWQKQRRCALLIPAVYSNFYGTWNLINYLNDHDYQRMLRSQFFFSVTELIATVLFSQLVKTRNPNQIPPWWIYLLISISLIHIQLATGELDFDRMQRNIPLILSDIINLVWVTILLINYPRFRPTWPTIGVWFGVTLTLWFCYHLFFPFRE